MSLEHSRGPRGCGGKETLRGPGLGPSNPTDTQLAGVLAFDIFRPWFLHNSLLAKQSTSFVRTVRFLYYKDLAGDKHIVTSSFSPQQTLAILFAEI